MKHKKIVIFLLLLTLLILESNQRLCAQSYIVKPVVTNKTELVPGTGLTMEKFDSFDLGLNNNDDFIFTGKLSDGSSGIMLFSNGVTRLLIKSKDPSNVNDGDLISVNFPRINDNGTVIFLGVHILPGRLIKQTIYKYTEDEIIPLFSAGDPVQELESTIGTFNIGFWPSLNNNEEIAFSTALSDKKTGLFVFSERVIKPILITGDPFPVFDGNEILVFADIPVINDLGEIVFRARFFKGIGNSDDLIDSPSGVFLFRDGDIIPVKLPGQEAPGTNGLIFWDDHISWISLGNSSEVVYRGNVIIPGGDSNDFKDRRGSGLFLWSEGNTRPLVLSGDKLPESKGRFLGYHGILAKDSINDSGEVAAPFVTTDQSGIFLFSNDDIVPIFLVKDLEREAGKTTQTGVARINNQGNIVFSTEDDFGNDTIFMATKE